MASATKGNYNELVYKTLKEARTSGDMADVLKLAAKDKKLARRLAQALLNAKTQDDAAGAFAKIKEESITSSTADPEVIRKAKTASMVSKFVMRGELAMSHIKDAFNKAAFSAKTVKEVDAAF